jgi:3-oxoacyl-ACP reductase-like protein
MRSTARVVAAIYVKSVESGELPHSVAQGSLSYTSPMDSLFDVSGKVVLVTGGSQGIGEMIARGFVDAGAKVYISSRKAEVCERIVHLAPGGPLARGRMSAPRRRTRVA